MPEPGRNSTTGTPVVSRKRPVACLPPRVRNVASSVTAPGPLATMRRDTSRAAGSPGAALGARSLRFCLPWSARAYWSAPAPFLRRTTASLSLAKTASPANVCFVSPSFTAAQPPRFASAPGGSGLAAAVPVSNRRTKGGSNPLGAGLAAARSTAIAVGTAASVMGRDPTSHLQCGYMSDPPAVTLRGEPPVAGTMYSSHGPFVEAPWQKTISRPSGLQRA